MSETKLSAEIALGISRASRGKVITWRNNVGVGLAISAKGKLWKKIVEACIALVAKFGGRASLVKYGLCVGSSDRIGITPVLITSEMVGMTLGVFTAIEVKTPTGSATDDQENFIQQVRAAGGFAGIARTVDEAVAICSVSLL